MRAINLIFGKIEQTGKSFFVFGALAIFLAAQPA
jgi:hypothetical protein